MYRSMLREGEAIKESPLRPRSSFRRWRSIAAAATSRFGPFGHRMPATSALRIEGAGHYIAMDAPDKLATALLAFVAALRSDDQA